MPKRKEPTGTVEDRDQLDALLALENAPLPDPLLQRINTLEQRIRDVKAGQSYIDAHFGDLRGHFTPLTPAQAATALGKLGIRLTTKLNGFQALQQQLVNFASRVVVPTDTGEFTGNGKCYIQFVNVGMGDCTLITTPKGVKILIDCGSDALSDVTSVIPGYNVGVNGSAETIIGNSIKSQTFLHGDASIDIMILSHPDGDHHNKLQAILSTVPGMTVNMLYYGGAEKIEGFTSSAYIKQIAGSTASNLRLLKLREESKKNAGNIVLTKSLNNKPITAVAGIPNSIGTEFIDPVTGEIVLYYENGAGIASDFRLSVLASNVTGVWKDDVFVTNDTKIKSAAEMKLNATAPNKKSLVVSARCFASQVLVCGDATAVTEQFMVDYFTNSLATVRALRIGHHGSATSSCATFLNKLTGLRLAVASTGGQTTTVHNLPKQRILALCQGGVPVNAAAHDIWAFGGGDAVAQRYFNGITNKLYATGSNNTVGYALTNPG